MWDYIVLGQVPGTQVQVSFEMWLAIMAAIAVVVTYFKLRKQVRQFALLAVISWTIRLRSPRQLPRPQAA